MLKYCMKEGNKPYEQLAFFRGIRRQTVSFAVRGHSINQESLPGSNTGTGARRPIRKDTVEAKGFLRFFFLFPGPAACLLFEKK